MAKKRFDQQKIRLMLLQELNRAPLISCQSADYEAQIPADDGSDSFSRGRAGVRDNYTRPWRGGPIAGRRQGSSKMAASKLIRRRINLPSQFVGRFLHQLYDTVFS
jgi:hypothetical protein